MIYPTKVAPVFQRRRLFDPRTASSLWHDALLGDTAYATDGRPEWTKPSLDVRPPTNVVLLRPRDSSTVWLDLESSDPRQRFKLFQFNRDNWRGSVHTPRRHPLTELRWTGPCGDRSTMFYNSFRKVWVQHPQRGEQGPLEYKTPPYNPVIRALLECRDYGRRMDRRP